jgi:hypothetical protein
LDAIFGLHIGHKLEPRVYKLWSFAEGPLEVVRTR